MAAVIIPQWRILKSEQELLASPYTVPLSLTLVLVVVFLLDRACTLLCARWGRSTQVIFCCTLCLEWFLALVEVLWKTLASHFICWSVDFCDCATAGHVVWGKLSRVESRLLCAATSNRELVCAKLGSSAVFVSCASTEQSECCAQEFSLAGWMLMNSLKLVVGGNPCGNFGS